MRDPMRVHTLKVSNNRHYLAVNNTNETIKQTNNKTIELP